MSGIHIHPHDIVDEDMPTLLARLAKIQDLKYLFVEVNTIFERNPYPVGELPHNPVHPVVMGTGTLHANIGDLSKLPVYQKIDDTILAGADPLQKFLQATKDTPYQVIPWVNILNGNFLGNIEHNQIIDFNGNVVEHWLCPNAPDSLKLWQHTFGHLKQTYGFNTFLIDRIRYPDWAGKTVNPLRLFSCFCPHCQQKMAQQNIDVNRLKQKITQAVELICQKQYMDGVTLLSTDSLLQQWFKFRQNNISQFVQKLLNQQNDQFTFWLDLWPPAYSWILGQNYNELTKLSSVLKHFPYHKLGGGADVQGLIEYIADNDTDKEQAFKAFRRLFKLNYDISYQDFKQSGYPIDFVQHQNDLVRQQSQPNTFIYSGIQMWNIDPKGFIDAVNAANKSACNDLLYYCYGWANESLFDALQKHDANNH